MSLVNPYFFGELWWFLYLFIVAVRVGIELHTEGENCLANVRNWIHAARHGWGGAFA